MTTLNLFWHKYTNNNWCGLADVPLSQIRTTGVYVIWHGGMTPWTVRVGQGIVAQRVSDHQKDHAIKQYATQGLYVTWADVSQQYLDGVERYLAETLRPKVGTRFPDVLPIVVNSPWG